jgi:CRISPR/Cas system-associated exonuclease Cas4 (RecB family)
MIYLSASSIKDFNICSQRYYYRINSHGISIKTDGMKLGSAVHKALELSWNKDKTKLFNQAVKFYLEEEGTNDIKLNDKIKTCIDNYSNYYKPLLTTKDELEKDFKFKFNDIYIVGRIDRIIPSSGILIDWKTSFRDPWTIDDDPQFLLYKYAYYRLYNKYPNRVLYINLFSNKMMGLDDDGTNYDKLLNVDIPTMVNKISKNKFSREGLEKKNVCKSCQFREICFEDGGINK